MADTLTLISGPAELVYSRNPVKIKLETTRTDTMVVMDVFDGDNQKVVSITGRPDTNYHVEFEISEILNTIVNWHTPNLATEIEQTTEVVSQYHLIANEVENDLSLVSSLNIGWDGTNASLWVIKGGTTAETQQNDIFSYLSTNKKYLTWLPEQQVMRSQPVFLYYLHQKNSATLWITGKTTYDDGSSNTAQIGEIDVDKYDVIMINAGFIFNNLNAGEPTKKAVFYEITTTNESDNSLLATTKLYLENENYFQPVWIINANSLGGMDAHFFEGKGHTDFKAENTENTIQNGNVGQKEIESYSISTIFEINTGIKTKAETTSLAELLINKPAFEVVSQTLIPITIDKSQLISILNKNELQGNLLKYQRANQNQNFTPDEFIA